MRYITLNISCKNIKIYTENYNGGDKLSILEE
jgi:hypothetical protein